MVNLEIPLGKTALTNPVLVASGTFGYGEEYTGCADYSGLGAIVTKTVTLHKRVGNPPPRIAETASGMINAIGLENPGLDRFISDVVPSLRRLPAPVIVSIAGEAVEEYAEIARRLHVFNHITALELNISCPNIKARRLFSQDANDTAGVVSAVRQSTDLPVITKLSPNVTDIGCIAAAAESAGSDAIALVNTFTAMAVDSATRKSTLGVLTGGLSGPAIKPIALAMVHRVFTKVRIPVIGMGGIMSTADALEFMLCGASCVSVGTGNFVSPGLAPAVAQGIYEFFEKNRIHALKDYVGSVGV